MRRTITLVFLAASTLFAASIYDYTLPAIDGKPAPLAAYKGRVLLIVNVASRCGYTPQYAGLQKLYERYRDRGFVVLGFPANNFGGQEPGTNEEIRQFCTRRYNVTFPMYAKISVKGDDQAPLYRHLTDKKEYPATGGEVRWNFTKFLVGKDGRVVARFEPQVSPEAPELIEAIERALSR
jgi:glutathione peroxidase